MGSTDADDSTGWARLCDGFDSTVGETDVCPGRSRREIVGRIGRRGGSRQWEAAAGWLPNNNRCLQTRPAIRPYVWWGGGFAPHMIRRGAPVRTPRGSPRNPREGPRRRGPRPGEGAAPRGQAPAPRRPREARPGHHCCRRRRPPHSRPRTPMPPPPPRTPSAATASGDPRRGPGG